jgi:hypothetical protein
MKIEACPGPHLSPWRTCRLQRRTKRWSASLCSLRWASLGTRRPWGDSSIERNYVSSTGKGQLKSVCWRCGCGSTQLLGGCTCCPCTTDDGAGVNIDHRPVGNPKRKVWWAQQQFSLSKKPRFNRPVGESQTLEGDAC